MNYEELIGLINQLDDSSVAYMDYKTDSGHLVLSKEVPNLQTNQETSSATEPSENVVQAQSVQEVTETVATEAVSVDVAPAEKVGEAIESPMVGVAYLQPNPDEPAFVKVGDRVEQGEVVCIIEAMKLMNEIPAEEEGEISEICVTDGQVVEFGTELFRIRRTGV